MAKKVKKVRVNDPETGRFKWVSPKEAKNFNIKDNGRKESSSEKGATKRGAKGSKKKAKGKSDRGEQKESANSGSSRNAKSAKPKGNIRRRKDESEIDFIKRKYTERGELVLRDEQGNPLPPDIQELVIGVMRDLEERGIKYKYEDIIAVPDLKNRLLITTVEISPFYWNLLAMVEGNDYERTQYFITDLGGFLFKAKSKDTAESLITDINYIFYEAEKALVKDGYPKPYFTIPIKMSQNKQQDILRLEVFYDQWQSVLPRDIVEVYVLRAYKQYKKHNS